MRKFVSGLVSAFVVAGVLAAFLATPTAAPVEKPCWSHLDDDPLSETFGQQVPVWALGGGHIQHQEAGVDSPLGTFGTRAECEAAFAEVSSPE